MNQVTSLKLWLDAMSFVAIFWGGFFACYKAAKDYFATRVAEADKKSQAALIQFILKEIDTIKDFQKQGDFNEKLLKALLDKVIDDLKFLMTQLWDKGMPKKIAEVMNPPE